MTALSVTVTLVAGYLLGSIMCAVVVARLHGLSIHDVGSGNPGFTNVNRSLGMRAAVPVLVGDMLKGSAAVALGRWVVAPLAGVDPLHLGMAGGIGAVVGHTWPLFFGFRGGKGVATGGGVLLFLVTSAALGGLAVFVVVLLSLRYMSVASMLGATTIPVLTTWVFPPRSARVALIVVTWVIALAIVLRHRSNLRKLRRGEERRFSFKRS